MQPVGAAGGRVGVKPARRSGRAAGRNATRRRSAHARPSPSQVHAMHPELVPTRATDCTSPWRQPPMTREALGGRTAPAAAQQSQRCRRQPLSNGWVHAQPRRAMRLAG